MNEIWKQTIIIGNDEYININSLSIKYITIDT